MKLIIDIPENEYRDLKTIYEKNDIAECTYRYIFYGIPLSEELEKIKTEIMSIGNWREHYEMPIAYLSCLNIVEHHISELKGENK